MECIICGKGFESRRSDARFCSSRCRKKSSRGNKCDISVTDGVKCDGAGVTDKFIPQIPSIRSI